MALPKKLLSRDEVVVRHMRKHPKVLLGRALLVLLLLVVAVAGTLYAPESWRPWGYAVIWVLWLVLAVPILLAPWVRWMSTTYTVTTKRVITRTGILSKTGHDLPLSRISDVQQDRSVTDRIFRAGTLRLQTSADDPLVLEDIPQVETVQVEIANLIFHDVEGAVAADPDD